MFSKLFDTSQPTKLEILLKESYENKLKKYDFMKEFLASKIYFRGVQNKNGIFLNYEEDSLLAFTSLNTLQKAQQGKNDYFLEDVNLVLKYIPNGIRLLLNTGPNYGKEFLPNELSFLKDGKISPDLTQVYQMKSDQKLSISRPSKIPGKLIDALFEKMRGCSNIDKAFIAEILDSNTGKSNLMVGIKVFDASKFEKDIPIILEAVKGAVGPSAYVDFIQIVNNDTSGIARFMLAETKPFFDREYLS
jgi:hypothetical protein